MSNRELVSLGFGHNEVFLTIKRTAEKVQERLPQIHIIFNKCLKFNKCSIGIMNSGTMYTRLAIVNMQVN